MTGEKRRWPLEFAEVVATTLVARLGPRCKRIQVAGSIRRRKLIVGDVEILCIPDIVTLTNVLREPVKQLDRLDQELQNLIRAGYLDHRYQLNNPGRRIAYGPLNKCLTHVPSGMPVDVFCTTEEGWAMALVVRTGPKELNVRLMSAARAKGLRGHAYGKGYTLPDGSPLVCRTEEEVFAAVGWPYLPPEERR